jgi:hypothetical protein
LSIVNENNNEQDELEVDHLHAPLPWCLFVQLLRVGGSVSIVQALFDKVPSIASTKKSSIIVNGNIQLNGI